MYLTAQFVPQVEREPYTGPVVDLSASNGVNEPRCTVVDAADQDMSYSRGPTKSGGVNLHDSTFSVGG